MGSNSGFKLVKVDGQARYGQYRTERGGVFETPNFMVIGTKGAVKGLTISQLKEVRADILLVNSYHLWLRPGLSIVGGAGGIHSFMGWQGPILSDSGGFQVYSLSSLREVKDDGILFRSHLDGEMLFLSPEKSVFIQEELGVDIAMVLDECPAGTEDYSYFSASLTRTIEWAKKSIGARRRRDYALFAITQGGRFKDLRRRAVSELCALDFDGFAIGGLSVGEPKEVMYDVLSWHPQELPKEKIRYLMGVGTPRDIVEAVRGGVDLFDCVLPTRSGRFGRAFVSFTPYINIKNACFKNDFSALDEGCNCFTCRNHSRAYLHHLFKSAEMLGPILLSLHNVYFYLSFMQQIREAIKGGKFEEFYKEVVSLWQEEDGLLTAEENG
ncbi:MAG: tRNA guanosine(34) transglycosylase Tgt [Candidatus Dadabacteria bacterium]|nr:MAG: tRNA guanosine(34) transglycosylase Tgt [Candidatus Dadabacteria bacterium]